MLNIIKFIPSNSISYFNKSGLKTNSIRTITTKICGTPDEAIADIPHGASIGFGGFALVGVPKKLIEALGRKKTKDIHAVSNEAGLNGYGLDELLNNHQIRKITCSFTGNNPNFQKQYFNGDIEVELVPQGTFAEKVRAGGLGIPAFYTRTGVGSNVASGGIVSKFSINRGIEKESLPKEVRVFNDKKHVLVHSITTDYAFVKGYIADTKGNVVFNKTAQNFNPDIAKAGRMNS